MNVVGISAFYHESSCCLLRDGRLVAAASEERFSRVKHDPRLPVEAFRFCLAAGGLDVTDLDAVAYYESPVAKLSRQLWAGPPAEEAVSGAAPEWPWLDPGLPERAIRERLGWDGPLLAFDHHASHAASAFDYSGFPDAAVLTVDGVGEWATTTYGRARRAGGVEVFEEVSFPHSLGLLYSTITSYLGFAVNDGEYKVMGLAPYGEPRFAGEMRTLVRPGPAGSYTLDLRFFDFLGGRRMYSDELPRLLGGPPRRPGAEITPFHRDVARSLQAVLEELLIEKAAYLHARVGSPRLCLAGGVALNCVANGRLLREGPFAELFVQPAAGDAGGCLGAAALAHRRLTGEPPAAGALSHVFLGPRWSAAEVAALLDATGLPAADFRGREEALVEEAAGRLAGGQVLGWFHGAMEFGPRALGARSILASPLDAGMRERLNRLVKKREAFRPFAPSVLASCAGEHFDLDRASPFMLLTCRVRSPLALPGITHVDGSARPQTVEIPAGEPAGEPAAAGPDLPPADARPRFAALLAAFQRRTGCPVLVNTSFNVRGEPIVCSPVDALFAFAAAGLDALVLEDFLLDRRRLPAGWAERLAAWSTAAPRSGFSGRRGAVSEALYTFV